MPTSFLAIVLTLAAQVKDTEDVPVARDKWKSEYTEKTWGLKLKTVKYEKLPPTVSVVFEFTKDLQPDETKALNACSFKKEGGLEFCFFDEDGVILAKVPAMMYVLQGDVTGMKGDAIRCKIGLNVKDPANFLNSTDQARKVSKVEFRLAPAK